VHESLSEGVAPLPKEGGGCKALQVGTALAGSSTPPPPSPPPSPPPPSPSPLPPPPSPPPPPSYTLTLTLTLTRDHHHQVGITDEWCETNYIGFPMFCSCEGAAVHLNESSSSAELRSDAGAKPNILLVLTDDHGFTDLTGAPNPTLPDPDPDPSPDPTPTLTRCHRQERRNTVAGRVAKKRCHLVERLRHRAAVLAVPRRAA
jgi:hypothetical protein